MRITRTRPGWMCALALASTAAYPAIGQMAAPESVPPAIQEARRHMLDADLNTLTFRSMDQLFSTRRVPRGGAAIPLPRADRPFDGSYIFKGKSYTFEDGLERTATNALLVLRDGKVVVERYRNLSDQNTHFMSWSMCKSLTSLLVGLAVQDGFIKSIDEPVTRYVPELADTAYAGVTIRQALQMRSGVAWEERYDFGKTMTPAAQIFEDALVENRKRYADAALLLKARAHKPGEVFNYSTVETAVLGWVVERATKRPLAAYTSEKIWSRLGTEADAFYIADGPPGQGREFNGAGYNAILRDYGRLGQMVLDGGRVGGQQVVPAAWIAESTKPYSGPGKTPDGPFDYGYQWWTVKGTNSFTALGLQGQYIFIDPPTRTVVVKLSYEPPASDLGEETAALLGAVAKWQPGAP